jgi:protease-4
VHYVEAPLGGFEQFLVGMNQSAMVQLAQGYGLHLPAWLGQLPRLAPELKLLRTAQAGRPNVYAYCFCAPR